MTTWGTCDPGFLRLFINMAKSSNSALTVENWPIAKPIPYARNARKIPQSAIDKVAASIQAFGFRQPIVVDKQRVIIAGHTRLLAAQKLELKEVPVHVAKNLTVAQAKAYRLSDNRTSQEASWDNELLALEIEDLKVDEFDLTLTAFSPDELAAFTWHPPAPEGKPAPASAEENWQGMPEFHQEDQTSAYRLIVHFATEEHRDRFSELVGQAVSENTRSIWFPEAEIGRTDGIRYMADAES